MKQRPSFIQFTPFILWLLLVYILLTLPAKDFSNVGNQIPHLDKWVHAGLFGGVVFWFGFAYKKFLFSKIVYKIIAVTLFSSFFGIIMEFVQKWTPRHARSFSIQDMVADSIGAVIGFFTIRYIIMKLNKKDNLQ